MELNILSIIGASFAFLVSYVVTIEYAVLVNLRKNRPAQMFFTLLLTIDALLTFNAARVFFGDYPLRITLLTIGFYMFGFVLSGIGFLVWKTQAEGARKREAEDAARD